MIEDAEGTNNREYAPLAVIGTILIAAVLLALFLSQGGERPLKPFRPTLTPGSLSQNSQAILVTFDELNANPHAFRNQRIRISGDLSPQPKPDCRDYKGPLIRWALINDNLQMNGQGYESVIKLVPAGTAMTVEGIWRFFEGSVGCGKGAAPGVVWYLQVEQIVQPNPLPNYGPIEDINTPDPLATDTPETITTTPAADGTAVPSPTGTTATPTGTATPRLLLTPTALPDVTITPDEDGLSPTPISGRATPTPTDSGDTRTPPTATTTSLWPTSTSTIQVTRGTAVATPPPLVTGTPGPTATPGPSPTSNGYPAPSPTFTPESGSYPGPS